MVTTTLQRKHKKNIKKPTKKEIQTLAKAFDDLLFYSRAHLRETDINPDTGDLHICGRRLYTWGDLHAAIHRAEQVLEGRKDS
jgi:hypothetical protein